MGTVVHHVVITADKLLALTLDYLGRWYEFAGRAHDIAFFMYKDTIHYRNRHVA